jgi:ketosteroid isomerase-like protein
MVLPGKVYRNSYHHLLIVREGLIVSGKEYLDTAVVQAAFGN